VDLQLTTKRLTLRPLLMSDAGLVIEMFTDHQIMKYAGGPISEEKITEEMALYIRRGGKGCVGVWCICDRANGEALGSIALLPLPIDQDDTDWEQLLENQLPDGEIEIGYFLKRAAWGKGYATEAAERLLRFAFEDSPLEEVVAVIDPKNKSSRRVLEKIGFLSTGTRRAYGQKLPGFSITSDGYRVKHPSL
jgi:RimJ/RimL family protein N-acetyltransferase